MRIFCAFSRKEQVMSKATKGTTSKKSPVSRTLRAQIRERGLTAYATAKKAGVSVDAVQRFMKDERGLTLGTVDKIAASLDLTLCKDETTSQAK
jgi:predicted transcriptional regulator